MENMNQQGGFNQGAPAPPAGPAGFTGKLPELGDALSTGWKLVMEDIGTWIGALLVAALLTAITFYILIFPMMAGLIYMGLKKIKTGKLEFGDLFKGFKWFGPVFVYMLLAGLASAITFGLGGLFIGFCCYFVLPLMIDRGLGFMDAIKESFKKFQENPGMTIVFVLVIGLVAGAGGIVLGIGALITGPLAMLAGAYAYHCQWGIESDFS